MRRADVSADPPPPRGVALVAFEDNYLAGHGLAVVTDPRHHAIKVDIWGGDKGPEAIGEADHILSRSILRDGELIGFWEVDPQTSGAVWHTFDPAPAALVRELDERTAETAAFLLDELGHAKVFTLDTMESVQARADRILKLAVKRTGTARASRPVRPAGPAGKSAKRK
jgi:hypothetical protein